MESSQTLHDFVLTLLSDAEARAAFQLNPEAALHSAGLSDITALDVQDVIPLVIDYVPVQGLGDLNADQLDLGSLESTPAGAIHQLQLVTQQVTNLGVYTSSEVNVAAAGALTTGAAGLTSWAGVSASGHVAAAAAGSVTSDAFSASADVSATLDSDALHAVAVPDAAQVIDGPLGKVGDTGSPLGDGLSDEHGLGGTVHGLTTDLGVDLNADLGLDLDVVTGTLPVDVHSVTPVVEETVTHVTTTVHDAGVTDLVSDQHSPVADATHHLPAGGEVVDNATHLLF